MRYLLALILLLTTALFAQDQPELNVGSKAFNEGVILGEILTQTMRETGAKVEHNAGMGGTGVIWAALKAGEIDAYVEYSGTLLGEVYATEKPKDFADVERLLKRDGVVVLAQLGFQNTYAIGIKEELAQKLGIATIGDLASHTELKFGFSNEFKNRTDGWPGLKQAYGLRHENVTGLEHSLAYEAIESGKIELTDLYSTDAEIEQYGLRILTDDRSFFPEYEAVILVRSDLLSRAPDAAAGLRQLAGAIPARSMIAMNAGVKIDKRREADVASTFLKELRVARETGRDFDVETLRDDKPTALSERIWQASADVPRLTLEHLGMVFLSLLAGILVALPLGITAQRRPKLGQYILAGTGVLQTVPSIALLVLLIPIVGIGWWPAVIALFLYSLLPMVRNAHAGLKDIDPQLLESADALGLSRAARLRLIELPLASRGILAGIKTAAVINVGTATLGGFIGAGGYGEAIFAGIRRQDNLQILSGAIPAALLALLLQGAFELAERGLVPKGLRLK